MSTTLPNGATIVYWHEVAATHAVALCEFRGELVVWDVRTCDSLATNGEYFAINDRASALAEFGRRRKERQLRSAGQR